jgi:hypothetical protein
VITSRSLRTATLPMHGLPKHDPEGVAFEYDVLDEPISQAGNIQPG